jgi:hypothetical protein
MTSRYNSYAAKIYAEHPVGLWALDENTNSATTETIDNIGDLGEIEVFPATGHSLSMANGYYINPATLSRNDSVPLVFGAYNSTTIYSDENLPALIVPGQGFLTNRGRYFGLTVEFWINIYKGLSTPKRVFGPIGSSDGLYVDGPFIGLKIDKNYSSHYVGTWGRPMLVQVSVIKNLANVIINGATVISMNIETDSLLLSEDETEDGNSLDWLGFYATPETSPTSIDCIAIYGYRVTDNVAKQRFVYGQGTQSVDTIFNSYTSTPISIDYSFSKFGKNRTYPDLFRWETGYVENLEIDNGRLSIPNYSLPALSVNGKTVKEWEDLQFGEDKEYFNINATGYSGYLVFNNLNITNESFRGFYGAFGVPETISDSQIIFRVENQQKNKNFEILLSEEGSDKTIEYKVNDTLIHSEELAEDATNFSVGLDLDNFLNGEFFKDVYELFADKTNSKLFIGGYQLPLENRSGFTGNIYRIGFYTQNHYQKLNSTLTTGSISEEGYFSKDAWGVLDGYLSSYTLMPKNSFGFFNLDIGISGYWENNISLSSLSKTMANGTKALDYFQFNIDYPEPEDTVSDSESGEILYKDSSNEILRSFVILKENENISDLNFWGIDDQTVLAPLDNIVRPTDEEIDKKFELYNDTLVYIPDSEDFDILQHSVVVRLEFEVPGILLKPIKVRSLEMASRSLESSGVNPIGTKFGKNLIPNIQVLTEKDYKSFNPLLISKSRSNYLYLTKSTGIGLVGEIDQDRKMSFIVNERRSSFYQVATLQFAINYPSTYFNISEQNSEDVLLFEIIGSGESHYRVYADFSSEDPEDIGKLYATNIASGTETPTSPEALKIFLNGIESALPKIKPGEWYFVGIQLQNPISFDGISGEVSLSGPARFDNVSLYIVSQAETNAKVVFRFWGAIDGTPETPVPWSFWYSEDTPSTDDELWGTLITQFGLFSPEASASQVYGAYTGANSIIADSYSIDATRSNIVFKFKDYEYLAKTDMLFARNISTPL